MSTRPTNPALGPLAALLAEVTRAPPLRELLERVLDAACQLTHADAGVIGLYDPAADVMRASAIHESMHTQAPTVHARGDGIGGHIIATGNRYHGRYGDLPRPVTPSIVDHQALGLPLSWNGLLLGYIALFLAPPRKFLPAQIEMIEPIACIATIAVEHSQRQEEEHRRSSRFELIARIAADIHREPDCNALLQRAADAIHHLLKFPNVDIPLIDPNDPNVLIVRIRGGSYKRKIHNEDHLPIDRGIMGAAARERTTQLVNDVSADPRYICPPGVTSAQAELAVPICSGERVLGVLNVEGNRHFDELDRRSLEVIADYLAVAIDNFRWRQK